MLRPTILPAASSLIAWMYCEERVFATYIVRSSGDSASPFGYSQFASTLNPPSGARRYTPGAVPKIVLARRARYLPLMVGAALVWVGEVEAAVRVTNHIVRAVEAPAFVVVDK